MPRMVVDLPLPLLPRNPKISPFFTANEIFLTATNSPKRFSRSSTKIVLVEGIALFSSVFSGEAGDHGLLEAHVRPLRARQDSALKDPCLVHERHQVAQLALVEIGGGHDDRHACLLHVEPEMSPNSLGHRVHAVGGLVRDEAFRFVDERAGQPCFMPPGRFRTAGRGKTPVEESQVFLFPALALHAMDAEEQSPLKSMFSSTVESW